MTDAPDGDLPLPGVDAADDDAAPSFDEPWQARAFGVAVALADGPGDASDDTGEDASDGAAHGYEWAAFQSRLIAAVETDAPDATADPLAADDAYYRQWLAALERLLDDRGLVDREEVADRAAEFAAGDRDASEFVAGDR